MDEMRDAMRNCLTTIRVLSFMLDAVYDIKDWVAPHAEQLHDHTQPKCFKFIRNSSGKCEMFYRNYSHMQWEGPVIVLKSRPTGRPSLVKPTLNKIDVEGLRRDLNKFQEHYPEKASSFWSTWVEKIDDLVAVPEEWEWPLDTLQSAEKVRPTPVDRAIPNHLQALQDKETEPTREIYTGRYVAPHQRENPVECVDSFLETLQVETFVAVFLSNCDDEPVIGVVKEVTEDQFKIHYWKGTYRGKWAPLNVPRSREPWTDMLTKECIILHAFQLTNDMKLQPTTRKHLSEKYTLLKTQSQEKEGQ